MRPFTARQSAENAAFLAALAASGNARLAGRTLGVNRSTYFKRRARCPLFARDWDAALAEADARLAAIPAAPRAARSEAAPPAKTRGGEPHLVRTAAGRLQRRAAPPGRMTEAGLARLLDRIAETNNMRLAADEAGVALPTLLARARRSPAFAQALRIARAVGDARIRDCEVRALEEIRARPILFWLRPWPEGMTLHDAMLIVQHQRAREDGRPPGPRHRPAAARAIEALTMEEVGAAIYAGIERLRRRARFEAEGTWRLPDEPPPPYAAIGPAAASPPPPDPDARPARRRRR